MARQPDATPESKFIAPTDPEALVTWLNKKRQDGRSRVPEQVLRQNLSFVLGHQWIVWDSRSGRFKRPQAHRGDPNAPVRITANKIAGLVERAIAKLTKDAPEPEARPVSDDENDIDAAKVETRILEHELYRLDWERWLTKFYFWPVTLGWSYAMVWWDPKSGKTIGQDDKGTLTQGEVCIEEVPAFELAVDPNANFDMNQAKWAVRTTTMSKEAVWEKWGKVPVGTDASRSLADEVYGMSDDANPGPGRRTREDGDFIKVHQFWLRPGTRINPAGMVVTWAGDTILDGPTPYPYKHGRLPFTQLDLLPGIGTREGRTWVTDLIPLQIDYNDARSREATIRRTLSPKVLAPTGSIDPRRMTSRVEVIDYAPTGPPPTMMIPDSGWIAQYENGMTRADDEMGDRAGQQDVSSGQAPSASMPAAAILALQEADDTRLAISAKLLAQFIRDTGWQVMQLVRQYWEESRVVRTWSDDGDLEVQHWTGMDVSDNLDIYVSSESALPKSKAARTQLTMELVDKQLLTDPRQIVKMLDIPGTDSIMESMNKDTRKAHRENGYLMRGEQVPVQGFDNHMVHLQEHHDEMKESWYDLAPPTDPRRVAFDAHTAIHNEMVLGQLQQATPPGTPQQPAPPGVAPQPQVPGNPPMVMPAMAGAGSAGGPPGGNYLDPMTGLPPSPLAAAAGQAPSALTLGPASIRNAAGIGGVGQPGIVPGIDPDQQAASMGG